MQQCVGIVLHNFPKGASTYQSLHKVAQGLSDFCHFSAPCHALMSQTIQQSVVTEQYMYYAVLLLMMILHHHQQQYPLQVYEMMFHQQSSHHLRSWPSFLKRPHALCQPTMQTSSKKEANAATATPSFSVLFGLCYSTSFEFEPFVPCRRTSNRVSVYTIAGEYEKVLPTNQPASTLAFLPI